MDEPFGALDPVTRGALQQEMTRIHRLLGRTIVLVTHDIDEALTTGGASDFDGCGKSCEARHAAVDAHCVQRMISCKLFLAAVNWA